jgi:magnesium-transporting ATPase (P-type)
VSSLFGNFIEYLLFELFAHLNFPQGTKRAKSIVKKKHDKLLFFLKGSVSIFFSLTKCGVACIFAQLGVHKE